MFDRVIGGPGFSRATTPSRFQAPRPCAIELGLKPGAHIRASERHQVVVLARLA
jgi:hypothetical protein